MERIVNFKYDTMSFLELLNNPGKSIARWIEKAIAIAGKGDIRLMALEDDDLKPLWEQIGLEISFDRHSGVGLLWQNRRPQRSKGLACNIFSQLSHILVCRSRPCKWTGIVYLVISRHVWVNIKWPENMSSEPALALAVPGSFSRSALLPQHSDVTWPGPPFHCPA